MNLNQVISKSEDISLHWYALYTMPRSEKKVAERLISNGFEIYLPLLPSYRTWSDRKKKIWVPLVPGFVFVKSTENKVYESLNVQGALGILRYMGKPARVRDYEINNLRILLKEPEYVNSIEPIDITEGEEIEVIRGPFIGLIGKCIRIQGKFRIIVEISALGRVIEVNVPLSFLEKRNGIVA